MHEWSPPNDTSQSNVKLRNTPYLPISYCLHSPPPPTYLQAIASPTSFSTQTANCPTTSLQTTLRRSILHPIQTLPMSIYITQDAQSIRTSADYHPLPRLMQATSRLTNQGDMLLRLTFRNIETWQIHLRAKTGSTHIRADSE